ncbi:LysM peptidoglycan-binding domain-containing protein [Jannaschia aquimarina]|uniref:LysM domain/BON superfamily protein n=1 Tax=Jannaschia aquimarina TaxID=935700 RepID=A0A0D1EE62_9RHOB|nr:LysM peptidoglycan-binding domain-containing protein [Jannaschia aquimarina]KIT15984.1 LysM domain/BON superfamily protein [Jannaschia aquimarina]SNS99334.1 Nucleoid-associated protein YgaU, contains BON and LysM domains [Jannaschia aquimarina]
MAARMGILAGIVVAGAIGFAVLYGLPERLTPQSTEGRDPPVQAAEPKRPAAPETAEQPAQEEASADPAPVLEIVRVEADGAAIVAGRADPSSEVRILLDGSEIIRAPADVDGNFVAFLTLPESTVPRIITAEVERGDGRTVRARDSVIVAPPAPREKDDRDVASAPLTAPRVAGPTAGAALSQPQGAEPMDAAVSEPPAETAGGDPVPDTTKPSALIETAAVDAPDRGQTIDARPVEAPEGRMTREAASVPPDEALAPVDSLQTASGTAPEAPRVFRAGADGVRVLSAIESEAPPKEVRIDAISYDDTGDVRVTGRAKPSARVQLYLDGEAIGETSTVDPSGLWDSALADVKQGVYTLRIDEIDEAGSVRSRVETPFERTAPEIVAAAANRGEGVSVVTVQPGFTLWAISEGYFGSGVNYVQIFEANRDLIRDPDLIYPGQVITLPTAGADR